MSFGAMIATLRFLYRKQKCCRYWKKFYLIDTFILPYYEDKRQPDRFAVIFKTNWRTSGDPVKLGWYFLINDELYANQPKKYTSCTISKPRADKLYKQIMKVFLSLPFLSKQEAMQHTNQVMHQLRHLLASSKTK